MLNTNRLIPPLSQMTNIPKVDDLINKLDTGWYKKSIFYQFLSLKYIDFVLIGNLPSDNSILLSQTLLGIKAGKNQ